MRRSNLWSAALLVLAACSPDANPPPAPPPDPHAQHKDPACDWACGEPETATPFDLRCVCPFRTDDGVCHDGPLAYGAHCANPSYVCHPDKAGGKNPRCLPLPYP